jgi:hypothetical protein
LAFVSWAPFGAPVVPEVYRITAVSESSRAATAGENGQAAAAAMVSSSMTTMSVPVAFAADFASAATLLHTSANLAPESPMWCSISRALRSGFIGTTVAPARSAP